jgi:hypothetical protein
MGNRLPYGLGGSDHWLDMLGGGKGKVNVRRHSAGLCSLGLRQGGKPVLSRAAVCANPPAPADYGAVSEQRELTASCFRHS